MLSASGEPVYGPRDEVDLARLRALGLPFWLAGGTAIVTSGDDLDGVARLLAARERYSAADVLDYLIRPEAPAAVA